MVDGSPLHAAVARRNPGLVALPGFGADPAAADTRGATPLDVAARAGDKAVMEVFASHGAVARSRIGTHASHEAHLQGDASSLRRASQFGYRLADKTDDEQRQADVTDGPSDGAQILR
jgi:ankyrin repeat protein